MSESPKTGLTVSEKRPYKEIAAQQREELGLEMPTGATMKVEGNRKRKRVTGGKDKSVKGPKRATTAFFFFAQDERANIKEKNPEFKVTEISKELGRMWREMDDKAKDKYNKLAEKDKKRYEAEKNALVKGASQDSEDEAE